MVIEGLSVAQFERIAKLGPGKAHGRKVLIRTPKFETPPYGESRAYYMINSSNEEQIVRLVPFGGPEGTTARSTTPKDSYAYANGGRLFVAAVDAAKELASAWGLRS